MKWPKLSKLFLRAKVRPMEAEVAIMQQEAVSAVCRLRRVIREHNEAIREQIEQTLKDGDGRDEARH